MQFPAALDLVIKALEEVREMTPHTPFASREVLDDFLTYSPPENLTALSRQVSIRGKIDQRKIDMLDAMNARVAVCTKCPHLASTRTQTVFGVGNPDADIMFVGEAPGADEDRQGEPFVGRAGQLLTKIIETMGLKRGDVYIANILKCRPDTPGQQFGNRPPTPDEMKTCLPYLLEQIDIIQPKVLVALGATAVEGLLGMRSSMSRLRGAWHEFNDTPLMITYHPAYLLRSQALSEKRKVWEDMLAVMEKLERPISEKQRNYFL